MAGLTKEKMAEARRYRVYKHTLPDGRAYIGMTSEEKLYRRFQYGGNVYNDNFHAAVYDIGWNTVETEILADMYCSWYEAHAVEVSEIEKAFKAGVVLFNKDHAKEKKEPKQIHNLDGVTLVNINTYFPTLKAAAEFIGVTKQAVSIALKENRACKGWTLAYGDVTTKEEEEEND